MTVRAALERQAGLAHLLEGRACSQVALGDGDALILDFGELLENPDGQLTGALVLVLDCPWRIDGPDLPAVGWEDYEEDIADLSTVLIGRTIEDANVRRPGYDLALVFTDGHRLRVFPDCRAYYSDELSGGVLPWQIAGRDVPGEAEPAAG